jgi:hypothetical protein
MFGEQLKSQMSLESDVTDLIICVPTSEEEKVI